MGLIDNIRNNRQEKEIQQRLKAMTSLAADSPRAPIEKLNAEAKVFESVMLSRREIQRKEKEIATVVEDVEETINVDIPPSDDDL